MNAVRPEQRGKIGAEAASLGLGHKADSDILEGAWYFNLPDTELMPIPNPANPSWDVSAINKMEALSLRLVEIGDIRHANLFRNNLSKPRSYNHDFEATTRMVAAMEKTHAAKNKQLQPVQNPIQYNSLCEIDLIAEEDCYSVDCLPREIANRIIVEINYIFRFLAKHGYRQPSETIRMQAPLDIRETASRFGTICGSALRFIRQNNYLKDVSRVGNSQYARMTFGRRLKLVDEALQQLKSECCAEGWTIGHFMLVTPEIKQRWQDRQDKEPLPEFFARNLFEYTWPDPCNLLDGELDKAIQQHPDINYVDLCRDERMRRHVVK